MYLITLSPLPIFLLLSFRLHAGLMVLKMANYIIFFILPSALLLLSLFSRPFLFSPAQHIGCRVFPFRNLGSSDRTSHSRGFPSFPPFFFPRALEKFLLSFFLSPPPFPLVYTCGNFLSPLYTSPFASRDFFPPLFFPRPNSLPPSGHQMSFPSMRPLDIVFFPLFFLRFPPSFLVTGYTTFCILISWDDSIFSNPPRRLSLSPSPFPSRQVGGN